MKTKEHPKEKSACGCEHSHRSRLPPEKVLLGLSGLTIAAGFALKLSPVGEMATTAVFLAGTIVAGLLVFPSGLKSLFSLKLNMNALMTVAVTGAWLIGEYAEGAVVVFLFALSEWLESLSVERARNSIRGLLSLAPETAIRKTAVGRAEEVDAGAVEVGETVIVRSGQRVPLDGTVRLGASSVNQAPITGESVPVDKQPGDPVFAGTVNGQGSLEIEVTKPASESTLSRIIHLVEEAEYNRAPTQRFVDRFAAIYTPTVFIGAVIQLTALILVGLYLVVEAVKRFYDPQPLLAGWMMAASAIALLVDLTTVFLLWAMSKGSLNVWAAFLHNLTDAGASLAVLVGGAAVWKFGWSWADPALTLLIAGYILWMSIPMLRHSAAILMEAAPAGLDTQELVRYIEVVDNVKSVHHLHIWELDEDHRALEAHVVIDDLPPDTRATLRKKIKDLLHDKYHIGHSTLELETEAHACATTHCGHS